MNEHQFLHIRFHQRPFDLRTCSQVSYVKGYHATKFEHLMDPQFTKKRTDENICTHKDFLPFSVLVPLIFYHLISKLLHYTLE